MNDWITVQLCKKIPTLALLQDIFYNVKVGIFSQTYAVIKQYGRTV